MCEMEKEEISQNSTDEGLINISEKQVKKRYILWSCMGVISLMIMKLNYCFVDLIGGVEANYSGYKLILCYNGTLGTSARMMLLLIVVNIAIIITGLKKYSNKDKARRVMFVEAALSTVASLVTFINVSSELQKFSNTRLVLSSIGTGAYVNLVLSISLLFMAYFLTKEQGIKPVAVKIVKEK